MAKVYYISHPQVVIDPDKPVPNWSLSEEGQSRLGLVANRNWVRAIATFVSSTEAKALETAQALRGQNKEAQIITRPDAHENDRSATGFIPPDAFEGYVDRFFANPEDSVEGWETARNAQTRIVAMMESVVSDAQVVMPIAFTGHGGVGTLLLLALQNQPIARLRDQPAGGGNVFAFDSDTRTVHHGWIPIEEAK